MYEPIELIGNGTGMLVVSGLVLAAALMPAGAAPGSSGPGLPASAEILLEVAPPEPEPIPQALAAAAEPPPMAEEKPPEPPPPPPPPMPVPREEPPKPPEPDVKPVEMLRDEDGTPSKVEQVQAAPPEIDMQFGNCLQRHAIYPTTKEAFKQLPHGNVQRAVSVSGGAIIAIDIIKSSGSAILDTAARSSVLTSGCGAIAGSGKLTGEFQY